jgi:hypothetical protein
MVMSSMGQCGRFSGEVGVAASTAGDTASVDVGAYSGEATLLFPIESRLISSVGP